MVEKTLTEQIKEKLMAYQPDADVIVALEKTKILLLVGITGAGKNRIFKELAKTGGYYFIVSHTTRAPRKNEGVLEKHGIDYYFVNEPTIMRMLQIGEFIECKLNHNKYFYGTSVAEVKRARQNNQIATTDLDVKGVDEYVKLKPDTTAVFVLPPNFAEWQKRLKKRGIFDELEARNRLESALFELETALSKDYYHFVINDELNQAVEDVKSLANGQNLLPDKEVSGRQLAQSLLNEISKNLKS